MSTEKPVVTAQATDIVVNEVVPGVDQELVPYAEYNPEDKEKVDALMAEIDLRDSNSIIFFGTKAQQNLTTISDQMLDGVKNKETGRAGEALSEMVAEIRGFDVKGLDPNQKQGFFARLFGRAKPLVKFLQRYEDVSKQIDKIGDDLESHKTILLKDIAQLDRLYDANLEYFHTLEHYIAAGDEKLRQIDEEVLPEMERAASESEDMLKSQELRDMRSARDDLERRVHDLRLTRQVTMQSLPSIRLVQENDKGLVTKINSTLANTMPLWRQQLAQTVTIWRSHKAAETVESATDLTNELLEANAENLQQANRRVREQMERGVFDIDVVQKANDTLIATIEESLQIADEGKRMRAQAQEQLNDAEAKLKATLASAKAHSEGAA